MKKIARISLIVIVLCFIFQLWGGEECKCCDDVQDRGSRWEGYDMKYKVSASACCSAYFDYVTTSIVDGPYGGWSITLPTGFDDDRNDNNGYWPFSVILHSPKEAGGKFDPTTQDSFYVGRVEMVADFPWSSSGATCTVWALYICMDGVVNNSCITVSESPPVASFKSLNVIELGRSDEKTFDGGHMVGGSIRFDPTASYDSDGQIITYEWDFDNGNKFSTDAPNIYDVIFQEARIYNVTLTVTDNDGLTNTFDERLDLTLKEGDLIFIRTAWWNIPFDILGHDYTHVGMYTEGQWMIETILTGNARSSGEVGVVQTPVSGWSYPSETFATLVRVKTANDKIRQRAVAFAQSKLSQGYDLKVRKKSVNQPNYYCSELIWAAYYKASKGKIDLGNKGKKGGVWPDNIINDDENTKVIGYHWEHNP